MVDKGSVYSLKFWKINFKICSFLAFYLNVGMIENMFANFFVFFMNRMPPAITNLVINMTCVTVIIGVILINGRVDKKLIKLLFGYLFLYSVSLFITPGILPIFLTTFFRGLFSIFLVLYLFSRLSCFEEFFNCLKNYIYIGVVYALSESLVFGNTLLEESQYMAFTYNSMIPMLTALVAVGLKDNKNTFKNKANVIIARIAFLIMFFANILYGARGAILCVAIALMMILYFSNRDKRLLYSVFALLMGLVFYVHHELIIQTFLLAFPDSRTLQKLAGQYFLNTASSARSLLYNLIWENFLDNPFAINGFLSDRVFLAHALPQDPKTGFYGIYAHNFILEILFQFGVFGIPFLIWFAILLIRKLSSLKKSNIISLQSVFTIATAFCLGQLSFSFSYLIAKSFGFLLGVILYMRCYEVLEHD